MKEKKQVLKAEYRRIFQRAYELMDEPLIRGNCGEICKDACCHVIGESGETLGIYLLPFEFECILLEIPKIHYYIQYLSEVRRKSNNIRSIINIKG